VPLDLDACLAGQVFVVSSTERLLGQLEQYDLDLPAGTVNNGLRRIEPMLYPLYDALLAPPPGILGVMTRMLRCWRSKAIV
jgi:hypothetical protein